LSRSPGPRTPAVALVLPLEENIASLSAALHRARIFHRIYEQRGRQVVEVLREEDREFVANAYAAWKGGRIALEVPQQSRGMLPRAAALRAVRRLPVTAAVVLLAVACFPVTSGLEEGHVGVWLSTFAIAPLDVAGGELIQGSLAAALGRGEVWRLFTPAWLHFSFMHLAFNVALVVFFGRRVEWGCGSLRLLAIVAVIAAVSNVAQYAASPGSLFGGMSGVAYGLFAFVAVRGRVSPDDPLWRLPTAFVVAMLGTLVVMAAGVTEPFGLSVANAAHAGGLVCGAVCAWITARAPRAHA
jgi:GlpG protein